MDQKKTRILLAGAAIILVILFITFTVVQNVLRQRQAARPPVAPTGTPAPTIAIIEASRQEIVQESEEYTRAQEEIDITAAPTMKALERSTSLKDQLPYRGTDFSISYDAERFMYAVRYYEGREDAGERELVSFLKENGVNSIEALENYRIKIESE